MREGDISSGLLGLGRNWPKSFCKAKRHNNMLRMRVMGILMMMMLMITMMIFMMMMVVMMVMMMMVRGNSERLL